MLQQIKKNLQHKLVNNVPALLTMPLQFLPFSVQQKCLCKVINAMFKEAISDGDLNFLKGKWLKVNIQDLGLSWCLTFDNTLIVEHKILQPDVTFSGNINDLILIAGRKEDPDTLFFQRRLVIEGDTELGLEIKNLLDNIEFEHLSPFLQKGVENLSDFVKTGIEVKSKIEAKNTVTNLV